MIDISNIFSNKVNEYIKEDISLLNKKRERENDKTIDNTSSIEICYFSKVEYGFSGYNIESNDSKNINDEYIYVGCEDGNIKLVKINNKSIFDMFFLSKK